MPLGRMRSSLLVFTGFFLAVCAFASTGAKQPAPRFNAKTLDGEKFDNQSIKGKVVLLEFWTTWCHYCAEEAPLVEKLSREFDDQGLTVLAVNVGESKKTVKKYLEQHPRTCRVVLTDDTNLAAMYAATVYPIYVVIDRDGNIAATQRGAAGEDALRNSLSRAGIGSPDDSGSQMNFSALKAIFGFFPMRPLNGRCAARLSAT